MDIRTDLALEQTQAFELQGKLPKGVAVRRENTFGMEAVVVEITGKAGEKIMGRPKGTYITVEVENVLRRERDSFAQAVKCISGYVRRLLCLSERLPVLVAGLGNREITPDALGPLTADHILVTRHMVQRMPGEFGLFRPVSAIVPGVLGTTGMESAETVRAMVQQSEAAAVIAIDAIAARETRRLCSTVQISDAGIAPGAGIGNHRHALNRETLGVPVVALGVPTVTDASTLALDILEQAGITPDQERLGKISTGMIVTCSDIDRRIREIARVLSYGVNSALQGGLTIDELTDLTF